MTYSTSANKASTSINQSNMFRKVRGCFTYIFVLILVAIVYFTIEYNNLGISREHKYEEKCQQERRLRNLLSREMNQLKKVTGQQVCNILELKERLHVENVGVYVSEAGGWCLKESQPNSTKHVTDKQLAEALGLFLKGQKVASFGDGPGHYKNVLDQQGLVASYDAYDGAPFVEEVTNGIVRFLDLTVPQYGLPIYDWVVSLEVAEHIPKKYENILVSNYVRHARVGVVLSWAVPGQDGFSHVNLKNLSEVDDIMSAQSFQFDEMASDTLKNKSSLWWLRNNIRVYRRRSDDMINENES